jgi:hydrogenase/urease accessory protein HupE
MFDWRFLRGVAVAVAIPVVVLGIFVALPLMLNVDAGMIVHALAAIRLI